MKTYLLLFLFFVSPAALAVELFGIDLQGASRDQFRTAINNAGVKLVQQAGDDEFFDSYEADTILPGAKLLYLGFTKKDQRFAFAEYRFPGLQHAALLKRLKAKYGKPTRTPPKFLSDQRFSWREGDIEIDLYTDWSSYSMRLVYFHAQRLAQLRQERRSFLANAGDDLEFMPEGY